MKITFQIQENSRSAGIVSVSGVQVQVADARIQGSEKQIAWATQIMQDALKEAANKAARAINQNGLLKEPELDDLSASLEKAFAVITQKIDGKHASVWIDNRFLPASGLIKAVIAA